MEIIENIDDQEERDDHQETSQEVEDEIILPDDNDIETQEPELIEYIENEN